MDTTVDHLHACSMMSMGQPLWDDIKILGYVSMSVCLSVCIWDIDIKNLGCPMLIILGVYNSCFTARQRLNYIREFK